MGGDECEDGSIFVVLITMVGVVFVVLMTVTMMSMKISSN